MVNRDLFCENSLLAKNNYCSVLMIFIRREVCRYRYLYLPISTTWIWDVYLVFVISWLGQRSVTDVSVQKTSTKIDNERTCMDVLEETSAIETNGQYFLGSLLLIDGCAGQFQWRTHTCTAWRNVSREKQKWTLWSYTSSQVLPFSHQSRQGDDWQVEFHYPASTHCLFSTSVLQKQWMWNSMLRSLWYNYVFRNEST